MNGAALQSLLGIVAVFGLIGMCAWVARRMHGGPARSSGMIKLVGGTMVGTRERVVVVEVNDTWIVLGVAPGRVNALHALPKADNPPAAAPAADTSAAPATSAWPAFGARLRQLMDRPNAKRV
jgi:flagellar protein FliO/FliZ